MGIKIIEGPWEKISQQVPLNGRNVRIIVPDAPATVTLTEIPSSSTLPPTTPSHRDHWLRQLRDFSQRHSAPTQIIDLDRDRLFEELSG
jgi:hypothetical protein